MLKLPTIPWPFFFLAVYGVIVIILRLNIPDSETLLSLIKDLYGRYGYYLIFIGALFEAMFLITLYVPGSAVILLGAAISKTGIIQFPLALLVAVCGLLIGYSINYILGKYGWYHVLLQIGLEKGIEMAKKRLEKHQTKTILLGYFHPSGASILSTAAGVLKIPFRKFISLSFIAQVFWAILWGSLAYSFGLPLVEFFIKYFSYVVILGVVVWVVIKFVKR